MTTQAQAMPLGFTYERLPLGAVTTWEVARLCVLVFVSRQADRVPTSSIAQYLQTTLGWKDPSADSLYNGILGALRSKEALAADKMPMGAFHMKTLYRPGPGLESTLRHLVPKVSARLRTARRFLRHVQPLLADGPTGLTEPVVPNTTTLLAWLLMHRCKHPRLLGELHAEFCAWADTKWPAPSQVYRALETATFCGGLEIVGRYPTRVVRTITGDSTLTRWRASLLDAVGSADAFAERALAELGPC